MATDLENFPTSESAKKMLSYVSDGFYDNSYVGKWIYQVMGQEYDTAYEMVESLPDQLFPETATWGLMFHELKWGLPVKNDVSVEERRKLIYQKRDDRRSTTPYQMESALSNAYACNVTVSDIHDPGADGYVPEHPNIFRVLVKTEGERLDTDAITQKIKSIKQSHTVFQIETVYLRTLSSITYGAGIRIKKKHRRIV